MDQQERTAFRVAIEGIEERGRSGQGLPVGGQGDDLCLRGV
jgi:hypothetical protein